MRKSMVIELFVYVIIVIAATALLFMPKAPPPDIVRPETFEYEASDPVEQRYSAKELEDMVKEAYNNRDN